MRQSKVLLLIFFAREEDALIYICDDSDSKALQRFNVFDRWYNNSTMTEYVTKLNNVIEFDISEEEDDESMTTTIRTSLLYHNNNTNKENIYNAYYNMEKVINGDKPDNVNE